MATLRSSALDRLLDPLADCLTPESAERLLQFQLDASTRSRIEQLAAGANEGALSEDEQAEYADYVDAIDLIGILQTKARQMLVRRTGS